MDKARLRNKFQHARGAREAGYGLGKIAVGFGISGDEPAETGQDLLEVEVVERSGKAGRLIEIEDADLAAGTEYAVEFGEACLIVTEITEAEGRGDEVDRVVCEGQVEGVGFDREDVV